MRVVSVKTSQSNTKKATRNILVFLSVLKNFMNYCLLYKIKFTIMERLVLVTVLIVASTIASPVVDVSIPNIQIQRYQVSTCKEFKSIRTVKIAILRLNTLQQ